ncbi:MAG: bifunctional oligoribonuclease/PAP phosphatase NrnA [Desulfovibrio sp.]|jgi:phosphoesterase RecJ-like protein|nr:bifunctional oligoribonuclease/PAP phosphatase NrnA [Desulfovibrio sp.]
MFDNAFKAVKEVLDKAGRVLIATHVVADGDAVGSSAALALIARHSGCDTRIFMRTGLPSEIPLRAMPAPVVRYCAELGDFIPDAAFFVDCGDRRRAGPEMERLILKRELPVPEDSEERRRLPLTVVNIDHHAANPMFGDINLVGEKCAATAEIVGLFAEYLGLPLAGDLGEAVYYGLVTDTGNFTFANTHAGSLALGARILAAGLDVADFSKRCDNNWSLGRMRLWGTLMRGVNLFADGAVACCTVSRRLMEEFGLGNEDLEGFASWLRRVKGVRVGLLLREDGPENCKISLRSMGDFDVRAVTAVYGGGGHVSAAGATVRLPLAQAETMVLKEIADRLRTDGA